MDASGGQPALLSRDRFARAGNARRKRLEPVSGTMAFYMIAMITIEADKVYDLQGEKDAPP
jgi:hypothetical protein